MKRQAPELMKITFDTSQAQDMQSALQHVEKDMKSFERVVSSATNTFDYFQTKMKQIVTEGSQQGFFKQSIVVNKSDAENVYAALLASNARQFGSGNMSRSHDWQYDIQMQAAPLVQGVMKLVGKEALKMAQAQAKTLGGEVWADPTKKNPYRVRYFYPMDNAEEIEGAEKVAPFKVARSISRKAQKELTEQERIAREKEREAEANRIVEEDRKQKALRQKEIDKYNKDQEKQKRDEERREREAKKIKDKQQREAALKDKAKTQEEIKAQKEAQKERALGRRRTLNAIRTGVSLLMTAVNLLRRLTTAALNKAADVNREVTEAHTIGMSYLDVRRAKYFDRAHGLAEGTSIGAVQSVQSMFGDITNLDEGALEVLARVMGTEVAELVKSGIGGEEPDKLLERILDKYFEQFKQGKNSLGQKVGQGAALRELYTSLEGVSPEIATMFAKMADDYMSGFYGQFGNAAEWAATTPVGSGVTALEAAKASEVGKVFDDFIAKLTTVKDDFFTKFANKISGLLNKVANTELGMTDTEKVESRSEKLIKARALETKGRSMLNSYVAAFNSDSDFSKLSGGFSALDIIKVGLGKQSTLGSRDAKKAEGIYNAILTGPDRDLAEKFAMAAATASILYDHISPEAAKRTGDKVEDVSSLFTTASIGVAAQDIMKDSLPGKASLEDSPDFIRRGALEAYLRDNLADSGDNESLLEFFRDPYSPYWSEATKDAAKRLMSMRNIKKNNAKIKNYTNEEMIAWLLTNADDSWFGTTAAQTYLGSSKESAVNSVGQNAELIDMEVRRILAENNILGSSGRFNATVGPDGRITLDINVNTDKGVQSFSGNIFDGGITNDMSGRIDVDGNTTNIIINEAK